ncbi:hypothetical protein SKAU_G00223250 [Synaphobranchus kaupii]|uniref:Ig-like domain-containing protein n=1 Tax=Synaphobranchus kaupii TaxID=118154 RepID=A0A9Q1FB62_SYNKA|nr:hypothetical protein SKAU_G00223250 [Synaphobranchus kaupii]
MRSCSSGQNVRPPGSINGEVGGTVAFTTTISPTGPELSTIVWKCKRVSEEYVTVIGSGSGVSVPGPGYQGSVSLNRVTGSLELRELTLRDTGVYSVTLTSSTGTTYIEETTLNVYEKISGAKLSELFGALRTVLIAGNSFAILSCEAANGTLITRKWLKDGHPLSPSNRITFHSDNSSVTIDPVHGTDNGQYQCRLTNPVSTDAASYDVIVNYGPEDVVIQGQREMEAGQTMVLTCSASSVPPATFIWTFNGTETSVKAEEYPVANATLGDSGNYICVAANSVTGSVISSAPHLLMVNERSSGSQLGAIIGGMLGAVACVGVAAGTFTYMKKRKTRDSPINQDCQAIVYENTIDLDPPVVYENLSKTSADVSTPTDSENPYRELEFKDHATYSTLNSP